MGEEPRTFNDGEAVMRCPLCGSKECCGGDMAQDNTFLLAEIDRLNAEITSLRAFVREVNEAPALKTVKITGEDKSIPVAFVEVIARPRRMEV